MAHNASPESQAEVCGTYRAEHRFASEKLILKDDGTFIKEVTINGTGQKDIAEGRWKYNAGKIKFIDNWMDFRDISHELPNSRPLPEHGAATYPVYQVFGSIEMGDIEWVLYKQLRRR
jgi:hypothetical protein